MKKLVLLLLLLTGCTPQISGYQLDIARDFCAEKGAKIGHLIVRSDSNYRFWSYCSDGRSAAIGDTGVQK